MAVAAPAASHTRSEGKSGRRGTKGIRGGVCHVCSFDSRWASSSRSRALDGNRPNFDVGWIGPRYYTPDISFFGNTMLSGGGVDVELGMGVVGMRWLVVEEGQGQ
jgi:hypothetical protein